MTSSDEGDATGGEAGSSSGGTNRGTDTGTETGAPVCEPSPGSIEGPYYRPGMPIRSDLDIYGHPGVALHLRGRVLDASCAAIANAVVELWHAFPAPPGSEAGDADAFYDDTDAYQYYGQVATDREGRYAFDTLRPGWYLNGDVYRPAHIHVKVWIDGVERLTTQLYFEGDPFNAGDPWFDPTMVLGPDDGGDVERDFAV